MHDDDTTVQDRAADATGAGTATAHPPVAAFTVADMTCSHCVGTVRSAIERALPGRAVTVDLAAHRVTVVGDADVATVAAAAIRAAGYTPEPAERSRWSLVPHAAGAPAPRRHPPQSHRPTSTSMAEPVRYGGTPRWVKVFGMAAAALVVLVVIAHLTGLAPMGH